MAGYKRKRAPLRKKPVSSKKKSIKRPNIRKMINSVINKNIETKTSVYSTSDGTQIGHNNFVVLSSNLLSTSQGVADPMAGQVQNRIGDQINLRGVSLKLMLELNERYSDVTFRTIVVKATRGDTPNSTTLFTGLSGNRMLDTINKERYTILLDKWTQIKSPGLTNYGPEIAPGEGNTGGNLLGMSRATRIIKMWIPGAKFAKGGVIQYENGGNQMKFFDYHVLCYAYSNYSTSQLLGYNVGRVNDFISQMYYKDA